MKHQVSEAEASKQIPSTVQSNLSTCWQVNKHVNNYLQSIKCLCFFIMTHILDLIYFLFVMSLIISITNKFLEASEHHKLFLLCTLLGPIHHVPMNYNAAWCGGHVHKYTFGKGKAVAMSFLILSVTNHGIRISLITVLGKEHLTSFI